MGWIITLGILALFLLLKVGVRFLWDSGTSHLKIRIGLLRFSLSTEEKEKKPKKEKKRKEKQAAKAQTSAVAADSKKKKGMSPTLKKWIKALLEHWRDLFAIIGKILRMPTLDLLRLHIAVGNSDPAACALTYGKICAGLSAGLPVLCNTFRVHKQDIDVSCRYDLSKMDIMAEVEATVHIYEVFALIGAAIGLLLKLYFTTKNYDKAVQNI